MTADGAAATNCPVCGRADARVYLDAPEPVLGQGAVGSSRTDVSPGRILRCRECGLAFRAQRPSEEELPALYRDMDVEVYEAESTSRARTAARHVGIVERFMPPGRLLDVGCASGAFLQCAADAGWDVTGVEPSPTLARKAEQLLGGRGAVVCATLEDSSLPRAAFDVVTLWDVLEHVPDPLPFLLEAASRLRSGGHLFLNVPDLDSLQARLMRSRWPLLLPEHLNYFNRRSLRVSGERARLRWRAFGRRPVSFSVEYVLYRMAQHDIPAARAAHRLSRGRALGRLMVSLPLGELWGVWQAP